jgi:SAM-dependent methyltransferase
MPEIDKPEPFSFYKEHPKTCAPDDFWGQVKRTVNGRAVSDAQIAMIVDAVSSGLNLQQDDYLLDLCCGNGALTTFFFTKCRGGVGVDFSEKLIEIAKTNFERLPDWVYVLDDVVNYVRSDPEPERFTKLSCYGSFAYLEAPRAEELLRLCRDRYRRASVLYIGNCPDREQMSAFFNDRAYREGIENEADSAIGIWRTREEFRSIATAAGWTASFRTMPEAFYASRYRYDVVLTRNGG